MAKSAAKKSNARVQSLQKVLYPALGAVQAIFFAARLFGFVEWEFSLQILIGYAIVGAMYYAAVHGALAEAATQAGATYVAYAEHQPCFAHPQRHISRAYLALTIPPQVLV